jgi:hypothetical protein
MNLRRTSLGVALVLAGCSSVPSVQELQKLKPAAFSQLDAFPAECGPAVPPQRDFTSNTYYTDSSNSIIDPALKLTYKNSMKPFEDWGLAATKYADKYVTTGNVQAGKCAVALADLWASGDALLGQLRNTDSHSQVEFMQENTLAMITSTYLKVRGVATPNQNARISWWAQQVASRVTSYWSYSNNSYGQNGEGGIRRNNHLSWSAVGVFNAGVLAKDPKLVSWAQAAFNEQLSNTSKDGALLRELNRGKLSYHYTAFGITPLAYLGQASILVNQRWGDDPRLQKAMSFFAAATLNQDVIAKMVGVPQDDSLTTDGHPADDWVAFGLLDPTDPIRAQVAPVVTKLPDQWYLGGNTQLMIQAIKNQAVK